MPGVRVASGVLLAAFFAGVTLVAGAFPIAAAALLTGAGFVTALAAALAGADFLAGNAAAF